MAIKRKGQEINSRSFLNGSVTIFWFIETEEAYCGILGSNNAVVTVNEKQKVVLVSL